MEYIRIRNWDKFQHYKKRNAPWLKLATSILDDYEFACLPDISKLHLLLLLPIASRTHNRIPLNPDWLQKKMSVTDVPDLEPLFSIRFIELADASNPLAECKQVAMPEERRGEEKEIQTEAQRRLIQEARRLAGGFR